MMDIHGVQKLFKWMNPFMVIPNLRNVNRYYSITLKEIRCVTAQHYHNLDAIQSMIWYDLQVASRWRQHMNSQTSDNRNQNRCELERNIQLPKHVPSYKGTWSVYSIHQPFLQFLGYIQEAAQPWVQSHSTSTVLTQSTKSPWTRNSSETSHTYGTNWKY